MFKGQIIICIFLKRGSCTHIEEMTLQLSSDKWQVKDKHSAGEDQYMLSFVQSCFILLLGILIGIGI